MNELEARIIELETKISYQEDLIQELNQLVISQQKQIDDLKVFSDSLKEQLKEILSNIPEGEAEYEVPPHY